MRSETTRNPDGWGNDAFGVKNIRTQKEETYTRMNRTQENGISESETGESEWYAIKTRETARAEKELSDVCEKVFFPKEMPPKTGGKAKAIIPRVLFIRTSPRHALELERKGREHPEMSVPFWIYRYPKDNALRPIPQTSIDLLRLMTAEDTDGCEIYSKTDFKADQKVRVVGGRFQGQEGYVVRVKKNKHVIVRIEGLCMVMLPFIHPDLLQPVE